MCPFLKQVTLPHLHTLFLQLILHVRLAGRNCTADAAREILNALSSRRRSFGGGRDDRFKTLACRGDRVGIGGLDGGEHLLVDGLWRPLNHSRDNSGCAAEALLSLAR
jgi:hypothetical protein